MLSFLVRIKLVKAIKKKLFLTFILLKKKIFFFLEGEKKKKSYMQYIPTLFIDDHVRPKMKRKGEKRCCFIFSPLHAATFPLLLWKTKYIYIYIYIYISPLHSIIGLRKYYLRASHPTNIIGLWGYTIRCLGLLYSRRTTCKIFELLYCKVL